MKMTDWKRRGKIKWLSRRLTKKRRKGRKRNVVRESRQIGKKSRRSKKKGRKKRGRMKLTDKRNYKRKIRRLQQLQNHQIFVGKTRKNLQVE